MANDDKILDKLADEVDKIKEDEIVPAAETAVTEEVSYVVADDDVTMETLLEEHPLDIPQPGDILEGKVIEITTSSILIDMGALGTGIVLGREMKDGMCGNTKLKKGDVVSATLVELENEDGFIELSIREASQGRSWEDIEAKRDNQEVVMTKVLDANKGGLMMEINGITGFLPVSQLASEHYPRVENGDKNKILELLRKLIGQEVSVRIIDADREGEKLIVSEKAAQSEKEKKIIAELRVGDTIEGEISGVVDFGAFVKFLPPSKENSTSDEDKLEGLVHISELAWQLIENPREIVKPGDHVMAKIIGIDETRISLSMKSLERDPWSKIGEKYKAGDIVKGTVSKINPFGAFVYLDKDIHGLAHISDFREVNPGKRIEDEIKVNETYDWKILSIEPKDHRMGLVMMKEEKEEKPKKEKKEKKEKANKQENENEADKQ
jgi:small subunit ribosomal protein S1